MFCKKCGSSVSAEAKFCRSCGFKLSEKQDLSGASATDNPAPVEHVPVEPAPIEPAPVEPAPVEPAPVAPAPIAPAPIALAPVEHAPVEPAPVEPAPVAPAPVAPAPVAPAPVAPAPVEPAPVEPAPVAPAPVEPAPVAPTPVSAASEQKEQIKIENKANDFAIPNSFKLNSQTSKEQKEKSTNNSKINFKFIAIAFVAIIVFSGGGFFVWEQKKIQDEAIRIAKQEAELSKKQAQEALQLAEVERLKAAEAKKEFELAQEQANESQKQIDIAKKMALEAQQKAEAQSRLTLAAKEQAENEKRKADELAQQLARQSATAQRNSNATINWTGYLTCSRVLAQYSTNTDRFTKKININTNAGKGTAVLRTNDTTEKYTLEITANNVRIYSDGYFNNDRSRAWIIKTEGKLTGSNINTSGAMSTIDGKNTIREMCQFSLAQY